MSVGRMSLRVVGALVLAFLIASTVLYWLPVATKRLFPHSSYSYSYSYDLYEYTPAADALKAAAAEAERSAMNDIHDELEKETIADLNKAKAFPDVCTTSLVDCRGLPDAKVRPFFDAVLDDRQTARSEGANLISFVSLIIAIFALVFGIINASRKRSAV
jgi:hypothetical protein